MMNGTRNSRVELLRIISMVLVVLYHGDRTIVKYLASDFTKFNRLIESTLCIWGPLGVHVFIVISAWYMCDKNVKLTKIVKTLFACMSYVFVFSIIDSVVSKYDFLTMIILFVESLNRFFIKSGEYWFIMPYLLMSLISPLLNRIAKYKRISKVLLLLAFIPIYCNFYGKGGTLCSTMMFSYIYLVTAYIKRYDIELKNSLLFSFVIIATLILLKYVEVNLSFNSIFKSIVYSTLGNAADGSFMIIVLSYLIFVPVARKKPCQSSIINAISSYSLGVYCFHESSVFNVVSHVMSKSISLHLLTNANYSYMYLIVSLYIVIIAIIFEYLRRQILQRPFDYLLGKCGFLARVDNWINDL